MTFHIRPRQDFSLARFSKILYTLYNAGIPHSPALRLVSDDVNLKPTLCIELSTLSRNMAEMYVEMICKSTDCNKSDFKIIEVEG